MVPNKWKKCKNITFWHFLAFGGPCDVQKRVKVYKVYVSWKPWLHSLRWHPKKWFLSNWGRTRCNRSAQGLKMANCTSFKILTHIPLHPTRPHTLSLTSHMLDKNLTKCPIPSHCTVLCCMGDRLMSECIVRLPAENWLSFSAKLIQWVAVHLYAVRTTIELLDRRTNCFLSIFICSWTHFILLSLHRLFHHDISFVILNLQSILCVTSEFGIERISLESLFCWINPYFAIWFWSGIFADLFLSSFLGIRLVKWKLWKVHDLWKDIL